MSSIITDDMVKEMCSLQRPIPMKALGILNSNPKVGNKPNFIRKKGRSGIKAVDLPIYAPASVENLVQSICSITKLDEAVVEQYLEKRIDNEIGVRQVEVKYDGEIIPLSDDIVYDEFPIPEPTLDPTPQPAVEPELVEPVEDMAEVMLDEKENDPMADAVERGQ